jgi:ATP-dependent Clp protease ATP-binding subunit ClpA
MKSVPEDDLPGFALYKRAQSHYGEDQFQILLPHRVVEAVTLADEQLAIEAAAGRKSTPFGGARNHLEFDVEEEEEEKLLVHEVPGETFDPSKQHQVYAPEEMLKLLQGLGSKSVDRENHKRIETIYKTLKQKGSLREIGTPSLDALSALARGMPNFSEVVDLIREHIELAQRTGKPPRIPPILLLGPPGVGKTHFVKALATCFGSAIEQFQFDQPHSASLLMGQDKRWGSRLGRWLRN